jgi:NAD(P)-dependent dehydrogenase (short-subunit alcohol dehydrogenase family)
VETIHDSHYKDGIVVYAIYPGAVQTPLNADYLQDGMRVSVLQENATSHSSDAELVLQDDISLPGGFCVWLTKVNLVKRDWLSRKYVSANWNTEGLESQKVETVKGDKLKYDILV